jgi:VanZ family protein
MSASPMLLNPLQIPSPRGVKRVWLPVLCALAFIACTSTTFMGCQTTQVVVNAVWRALFGTWHWDLTGMVNGYFRKTGHFFGYGVISLLFRNAWYKTAKAFAWVVRSWLTPFAGTLAVVTTFAVSGLDELHQHFIPGRVGCLRDALVDTAGALFLNVAFWSIRSRRRLDLLRSYKPANEA